ncbi:MAG: beta-ketoacyl synthase N-terminal-like domain-containing protein [Pseudomonadota bacterium]
MSTQGDAQFDMTTGDVEPGSIAIVGMAGRFPSASTPAQLWELLEGGREATQWLSDDELLAAGVSAQELEDPAYVRASLVLPDMEMFDAGFFGFSKRDASVLDPQHRHFLECAWEALEDAGHMPENFKGAIGVFGGCGMQAYLPFNLLSNPELVKSMGMFLLRHTGNDKDFLCSRVSYLLDLKGPSISVQTACSTSLVAVHMAAQSLLSGECDMALAGGASIELPHRRGYRFAPGEIMSPDGHCRAFDDDAAGTIFGSGAAIVVLRRLEDALRDGDNIHAVIRGSAVNNDGSGKAGYFAPSVDGQARAAVEALGVAGVDPASVSYVEAHGTGTPVGDPIEIAALSQAYGSGGERGFCGIGSIKTNIGHLDTAAGVASLIKVAMAMRNGVIPASLNFSKPNSRLDLASTPFHVVAQARPWPRSQSPRLAGVNSLGVGGTNAHVIVQEAPLLPAQQPSAGCHVLTLSARTAASLERLKSRWAAFLSSAPADFSLANAAFTTQVGRRAFEHRCSIAAADVNELRRALGAPSHPRCASGTAAAQSPPVVMMFPGGGAHYPGAGRELLKHAAFREAVDACLLALPVQAPRDLRAVMFEAAAGDAGAAQLLEKPSYAMPALFTLEYALAQLWASWGIRPAAVIGHSAGEYAAAAIAGVLSVADALTLVCLRGQLFEQTAPGSMLAVDLPPRELEDLMRGIELDIAAINAPDLCIASGSLQAIAQLEQRLAAQGLEGRRLHIHVAAHSRLLDDVLDPFREGLSRIRLRPPQLPFISNLTGDWADANVLTSTDYWVRHLRNPVRFADGLQRALELPDALLLEVGPGQGLCALARQNTPQAGRTILASTCRANEPGGDHALMMASAGALWTRGLAPDWSVMRGPGPHRRISLPTYAFDHERHWVEPGVQANFGQANSPVVTAAVERKLRPATVERLAAQDDWFSVPQWTPLAPVTPVPATPGHWLIFGNRSQLTADVVARAATGSSPAILVCRGPDFAKLGDGSYTIAPGQPEHYTRLLQELKQAGFLPDHIVHLWSLDTMPGAGSRQVSDQTLAFDSLVAIARSVQELDATQDIRLTIVTAGSQSVHGEALPHPERALALGPCRVIPHEIPNVRTRLVDLASIGPQPAGLAQAIVHEAMHADEADVVALRGDARWTLRLVPAPTSPDSNRPRVRQGGVYLITGGLGDIALDLAAFLASGFQARLALVSRRSLPARASWRGLAASGDHSAQVRLVRRLVALEDAGAQVLTFSADVADPQAMARVVGECRARLGAINGVFHTAGALGDGLISLKTAESIEHVMRAKVRGGQVLHELLPAGDLDVFAVFSSTSVFLGAAGQVDYVAANAFLDALAASRSDGLCIRWGIWGDRGMAARTYGHLGIAPEAQQGVHPLLGAQIDADDGASFEAVYSSRDLWVLREHALAGHPGHPVLPGTAYIEIAHAAMMVLHPGAAVEIRSLSFEEAMVFDAQAPRLVRVEMRQDSTGYDFVVRSRAMSDERWLEHARASVGIFHGRLATAAVPSQAAWLPGAIPQERSVDFGPRWRNIARMQLGERIATAELQLPAQYACDLTEYAMHPAVVDMAATFGLHLVDDSERRQNLFVPLSVERIRIAGKVPLRCVSQALLKDPVRDRFVAFDIGLYAPDGTPLATFEGFSLRGVQPQAVAQHNATHHQPTLVDEMLACGIRGEDSQALFGRILSGGLRDVVVSSIDLQRLRSAMQGATSASPVRRPATAGAAAASTAFNRVERMIAQAWCELLGVETVRPDEDFFALGGHSLAAVRLFAQIRKHFNVDLPLATLFQAPTLATLSALVAQTGGIDTSIDPFIETADAAKQPDATHPTSNPAGAQPSLRKASSNVVALLARAWSPLIAINRGEAGRTPLFCVHGAGGNVLNFKVISDRLGPAQPFYGLQAQGVDGRMPPLATIEEMAAQYVEAVRGVDARGPYRLAGYSAGGMIALEMAHQLRKAGAQVELLVMIDTLSPAASRRKVSVFQKLWLMRRWSLQFALEWPGRRRRNKQAEASYAQALERLARGEPLPPELVEFHLFRNFMNAQSQYWPQPYDGDVALFKARESDTQYLGAGDKLGWDEHVTGDIRVVEIQGSHFSMMAEPGVTELTHALRIELETTPSAVRLAESYKPGAIAPTKHSQLPS